MINTNREKIIKQPSYWIEHINGQLYNAIFSFMKNNKMKQKDLAKLFEVSPGRISQILNDGEINFSLDKIIQILVKIGKVPNFSFDNIETYLEKERKVESSQVIILALNQASIDTTFSTGKKLKGKVVQFNPLIENKTELDLSHACCQ